MIIKSWKEFSSDFQLLLNQKEMLGYPSELYDPINYILKLGGKRVRPVLCLLSAQLFGGKLKEAEKAALGIEIFHNFTLVHDDIMDEAPLRRGEQTVHEKWSRDVAILAGDVMFVKAYEQFVQLKGPGLGLLLELFNKTAIEVCEGQQLDMNFESREEVSIEEYIEMIKLKTAVLLACSLKMGALISGTGIEDAQRVYDFGINLGVAFQIQDDYLDAYAKPEEFGKRVGGDIISKKKTYLLLTALQNATEIQKTSLTAALSSTNSEKEKVSKVLAIYDQLDIPTLTKQGIQEHYDAAMNSLKKINRSEELKQPLIDLAKQLMGRKS